MVATLRLPGFLIASSTTILALGYLGATVHYGFSLVSYESEVSGRALGIGMGVASLLEYLVETLGMTPRGLCGLRNSERACHFVA